MKSKNNFSIADRFRSFRFAFEGVAGFFRTEHNAWVHAAATVVMLILAAVTKVSATEYCILIIAAGFVWFAEIINTAVENMMDFVHPEKNPAVGRIKDLAAAAVLIASSTAFAAGLIIFIPKLF